MHLKTHLVAHLPNVFFFFFVLLQSTTMTMLQERSSVDLSLTNKNNKWTEINDDSTGHLFYNFCYSILYYPVIFFLETFEDD